MSLIHQTSILEWQAAMTAGTTTSRELTLAFLQRIATYNKQGIQINAICELNPDALAIAESLDRERAVSGSRGPLHGIPVLIKDNIATSDKMHTTAGALALADSFASADAFVVTRLREAGAVLLGKTNLTEWANFVSNNMPDGYSSRGGQVLNPYGPGVLDVGGSSSGSAAGIAAGFAVVAVGTETSGSILHPAEQNSLVGIKPTVGLISRSGIIPISHSQDTAGPIARTVTDAAILLGALTGIDANDPVTGKSEGLAHTDYLSYLHADGLRGARIGVVRSRFLAECENEEIALYEAAIEKLKEAGATVIDPVSIPTENAEWDRHVLVHEFKVGVNAYLKTLPASSPIRSLQDVIAFNRAHEEQALLYGQELLEESEQTSGTLTEPEYLANRLFDLEMSQKQGLDAVMKEHELDALLYPGSTGYAIPAKAGYPSITVPAGYTSVGKPFGIMLTGLAFQEPTLLRLAYAYEQATRLRVAPKMTKA
ncbi:amidase family protein [Brevibacillus porteri]|uniref:Amidase n=1 Tax=Brevibacillus porteri TaxID=2126350 RepID=A0ABX5FIZ8_9BACL|nr:amidase family protein [Brevibacillus porteri]MED1800080.1 amidase family protein [Brevibacillus porteri]MED2134490.1 amidase family protein [Brevibacillus porteri]MED2747185.1 amidase family protein [Brevibacillus porteri]MED2812451.1 amidase family protein [Brevibacillus porteri]MED2897008.1 amidase family protein [Brevibacillus porteri]